MLLGQRSTSASTRAGSSLRRHSAPGRRWARTGTGSGQQPALAAEEEGVLGDPQLLAYRFQVEAERPLGRSRSARGAASERRQVSVRTVSSARAAAHRGLPSSASSRTAIAAADEQPHQVARAAARSTRSAAARPLPGATWLERGQAPPSPRRRPPAAGRTPRPGRSELADPDEPPGPGHLRDRGRPRSSAAPATRPAGSSSRGRPAAEPGRTSVAQHRRRHRQRRSVTPGQSGGPRASTGTARPGWADAAATHSRAGPRPSPSTSPRAAR